MNAEIKLFACALCESDGPFCVSSGFRRTYMRIHLEKAHGMAVEALKLSRRSAVGENGMEPVVWSAQIEGRSRDLLIEFEATRPERLSEAGSPGGGPEASSEARNEVEKPESPWTAEAVSSLYKDRAGVLAFH